VPGKHLLQYRERAGHHQVARRQSRSSRYNQVVSNLALEALRKAAAESEASLSMSSISGNVPARFSQPASEILRAKCSYVTCHGSLSERRSSPIQWKPLAVISQYSDERRPTTRFIHDLLIDDVVSENKLRVSQDKPPPPVPFAIALSKRALAPRYPP
jgi:hypothetical protein